MKRKFSIKRLLLLPVLLAVSVGCLWSCSSGKDEDPEPPGPEMIEAVVRIDAPFDLTGYSAAFSYTAVPTSKAATIPIPIVVDPGNPNKGSCTLPSLSKSTVLTTIDLTHSSKPSYFYPITDGQKLGNGVTVPAYDKQNSVNLSEAGSLEKKIKELQELESGKVVEEFVVFGNMSDAQMSQLSVVNHKFKVLMLPDQLNLSGLSFSSVLTRVVAPKAVSVADACFESSSALMSLEAPNLTTIGSTVFRSTPIKGIDSKKLTRIGQEAFAECSELSSIDLSGVTEIGIGAFFKCEKLASAGSLAKAKSIGEGAFRECPVLVLDGKFNLLEMLGVGAFEKCLKLTQVDAPLLKVVESNAFLSCPITTVKLPAVEKVGRMAFSGTAIQALTLPACTESQDGFQDMDHLKTLDLPVMRKFTDSNSWGTTTLSTLKLGYEGTIEWPSSTGRIRLNSPEQCALYLHASKVPSSGSTFWGGHTWKSITPYSAN